MSTATQPTPPTGGPDPRGGRGLLGSAWLAATLTALAVGLAVYGGFAAYDAAVVATDAAPASTQLVDDAELAALREAAADLSQRLLTYRHDSFDDDVAEARSGLTPEFAEEYASAMERVRAGTARNEVSQEATAVSSAIISATRDEGQVLVFVNQETSSARTLAERQERNRLVVDLVRVDGEWTIAGVDALG